MICKLQYHIYRNGPLGSKGIIKQNILLVFLDYKEDLTEGGGEMKNTGMVFDIQRFSLHNGPGIRTTIFLKGCPLNCLWCHNPEAKSGKKELYYNIDKCVNCLMCTKACNNGGHTTDDGVHLVNFNKCKVDSHCADVCKQGALKFIGKEYTTEDTLEIVLKDKEYYKNSGGGITISGGEPLYQFDFTLELLKRSKKNNINTVLETSGFSSTEDFKDIMPFVDLFLFDYKETDTLRHKSYTGVYNDLILENLNYICINGGKVIVRCPIIPGYNDNLSHFLGIVELSRKYSSIIGIEIMSFHNLRKLKAECGGREHPINKETVGELVKGQWINKLKELGCEKLI